MKILFTSGSMAGGGAERVIAVLSSYFSTLGHKVSILIVRGSSAYPLPPAVRLCPVFEESEITRSIWNKIWRRLVYHARIWRIMRAESPDLVLPVHGGGWNGLFVILSRLQGLKVIAAEHISWTVSQHKVIHRLERRLIYPFANAVTVLTENDLRFYSGFLPTVRRISNPLSLACINEEGTPREQVILAAGQLDRWHHKGFDTLLRVFAGFALEHPDWRLQIAGQGSTGRAYLEDIARDLNILEQVDFLGFQPDMETVFRSKSIFVLSSRYEGFPLVLLEAMSQGCAIISFACPSGPEELIDHEVNGLLIPDQDETRLASGLEALMRQEELRSQLGRAAVEKSRSYKVEHVAREWLDLFQEIGIDL